MSLALIPGLPGVGPTELIIVLSVVLLFFGASRIPSLARSLGSGVREFKRGTREGELEGGKDDASSGGERADAAGGSRPEDKAESKEDNPRVEQKSN